MIILACYSELYFEPCMKKAKTIPLVCTTNLMPPETYTLEAAIEGWIRDESGEEDKRSSRKRL